MLFTLAYEPNIMAQFQIFNGCCDVGCWCGAGYSGLTGLNFWHTLYLGHFIHLLNVISIKERFYIHFCS
jgi:hypothetical protein